MIMSDYHGDEDFISCEICEAENEDNYWQGCDHQYNDYYEENDE